MWSGGERSPPPATCRGGGSLVKLGIHHASKPFSQVWRASSLLARPLSTCSPPFQSPPHFGAFGVVVRPHDIGPRRVSPMARWDARRDSRGTPTERRRTSPPATTPRSNPPSPTDGAGDGPRTTPAPPRGGARCSEAEGERKREKPANRGRPRERRERGEPPTQRPTTKDTPDNNGARPNYPGGRVGQQNSPESRRR